MPTIDIDALIVADLKDLSTIAPAKVYYVDEAPMDDKLPVQNGMVVPHIVVYPGRPQSSRIGRGIIGTREDPVTNFVYVSVASPNYAIAKQLGEAVNDRLMGRFYGDVSSELTLETSGGGRDVKEERVPPIIYVYSLAYKYFTNLG